MVRVIVLSLNCQLNIFFSEAFQIVINEFWNCKWPFNVGMAVFIYVLVFMSVLLIVVLPYFNVFVILCCFVSIHINIHIFAIQWLYINYYGLCSCTKQTQYPGHFYSNTADYWCIYREERGRSIYANIKVIIPWSYKRTMKRFPRGNFISQLPLN